MKILIFGVSNVGKTSTGKIIANLLNYNFYDLDEEVKKALDVSLEQFVHLNNLRWRDDVRGQVIKKIVSKNENMVFSITPISYPDNFKNEISEDKDVIKIELLDTPQNIFDRLVFSNENDVIYTDDAYKNARKDYYLKEIEEDLIWYSNVNTEIGMDYSFMIQNVSPKKVAKVIISTLN